MAISVKVTSNSKLINKKFKRFQSAIPRIIDKGVKQAGFQLLDIIRTKTEKGLDFRGSKFAPYSSSYLKKLSLILILLSSSIYASSEAWVVEDIRISGLQRISAGSIFSNIPVTIGDKVDTADIQNISKSI